MVGGDAQVRRDVRWCLEAVGKRIVHVGPLGAGHATKAVNNALLAAIPVGRRPRGSRR